MNVYLDTSAVVKLYHCEIGSEYTYSDYDGFGGEVMPQSGNVI